MRKRCAVARGTTAEICCSRTFGLVIRIATRTAFSLCIGILTDLQVMIAYLTLY